MRVTELRHVARHLKSWAPTLFVAVLLFGFAFIAQEVAEGGPIAFDRWLMVAFRMRPTCRDLSGRHGCSTLCETSPHWAVPRYLRCWSQS